MKGMNDLEKEAFIHPVTQSAMSIVHIHVVYSPCVQRLITLFVGEGEYACFEGSTHGTPMEHMVNKDTYDGTV